MADHYSLTPQQVDFFQTFGFLSLPGLFADSIEDITSRFDQAFITHKDSVVEKVVDTHYMKLRKILPKFLERSTEWATLLDDPRIEGIFSSILGEDYIYHGSQGDIFTGDTYWHSDLYDLYTKYQHIKIALYLDPMGVDSGAFRVLPGSHYLGDKYGKSLGMHKIANQERFGLSDTEIPGVAVPTKPGDVLVFDYRLKHATSKTPHIRRMLSIFGCRNVIEADIPELGSRSAKTAELEGAVYLAPLLENAPESRMRHLRQKLDSLAKVGL